MIPSIAARMPTHSRHSAHCEDTKAHDQDDDPDDEVDPTPRLEVALVEDLGHRGVLVIQGPEAQMMSKNPTMISMTPAKPIHPDPFFAIASTTQVPPLSGSRRRRLLSYIRLASSSGGFGVFRRLRRPPEDGQEDRGADDSEQGISRSAVPGSNGKSNPNASSSDHSPGPSPPSAMQSDAERADVLPALARVVAEEAVLPVVRHERDEHDRRHAAVRQGREEPEHQCDPEDQLGVA